MSNEPKLKTTPDRAPIAIERLIAQSDRGIKVPHGNGERYEHTLMAGTTGDVRTHIEHRPWMRVFRVVRAKRVTHTGGPDTWEPLGRPFHISDQLVVSVPVED